MKTSILNTTIMNLCTLMNNISLCECGFVFKLGGGSTI